jgi:hypothetical protein
MDVMDGAARRRCVGESPETLPEGEWFCPECRSLPAEVRTDAKATKAFRPALGFRRAGRDPCGRTYWNVHNRLLVLQREPTPAEAKQLAAGQVRLQMHN